MGDKSKSINWLTFAVSCVTRVSFWGSSIYIFDLCYDRGYSLTTMHVLFFTLGCALLMIEATLVVTGDALLARTLSRTHRVYLHAVLHTLGVASLVVGMWTIYRYKNSNRKLKHFTSDHAKVGLAGFVAAIVVAVLAIPTLFRKQVSKVINFGIFKRIHVYLGIIATILLWAGQITGFWTWWWRSSKRVTHLIVAAYVVGGFFLLIKSLYSTVRGCCQ